MAIGLGIVGPGKSVDRLHALIEIGIEIELAAITPAMTRQNGTGLQADQIAQIKARLSGELFKYPAHGQHCGAGINRQAAGHELTQFAPRAGRRFHNRHLEPLTGQQEARR